MVNKLKFAILIPIIFGVPIGAHAEIVRSKIIYYVDGDTFDIHVDGDDVRIRVWGIDTPEGGKDGFTEATEYLKDITGDKVLTCEMINIDRYGRSVAQCFLPNGIDIGGELIRSGYALEYCRYSKNYYSTCED